MYIDKHTTHARIRYVNHTYVRSYVHGKSLQSVTPVKHAQTHSLCNQSHKFSLVYNPEVFKCQVKSWIEQRISHLFSWFYWKPRIFAMSDDFGIFDDELRELEMDASPDVHSISDIETVLDTMRHLPEDELQQIRENLMRSMPDTIGQVEEFDLTSRQMLMLNAFTFVIFLLFGKLRMGVSTLQILCTEFIAEAGKCSYTNADSSLLFYSILCWFSTLHSAKLSATLYSEFVFIARRLNKFPMYSLLVWAIDIECSMYGWIFRAKQTLDKRCISMFMVDFYESRKCINFQQVFLCALVSSRLLVCDAFKLCQVFSQHTRLVHAMTGNIRSQNENIHQTHIQKYWIKDSALDYSQLSSI